MPHNHEEQTVIELSEEVNKEMFVVDFKTRNIYQIFVARESKSGDTIETDHGQRMKTATKNRAVFHTFEWAMLGLKVKHNEIDDEAHRLAKECGIRLAPCGA